MPEGRRRLAAIMFTDLVGYSALAQRDEPLALKIVEEHRSLLRPALERFGGREVKTMGDGSLLEFESALDAVECAIEMQRRLLERNQAVRGEPIEMRIGVHVGDVVRAGQDVVGDAVNIASRIEPLAEPGGICVTGPVREQVQNTIPFAFHPLERAPLKNIETPITVYRIELPWTLPGLHETAPFLQRQAEIGRLRRAASSAASGVGRVVVVTGAAGVGRSRLLEEFAATASRDGSRVLRARADRAGLAAPFALWSDALREGLRGLPDDALRSMAQGCEEEIVELLPDLRDRLGAGSSAAGDASSRRLFEGVRRALENLGRVRPTVVILDDLQWADPSSLQLLRHLFPRLGPSRTLVVAACRTDRDPSDPEPDPALDELQREAGVETIALAPFDAAASTELVRRRLRGGLAPDGERLAGQLFEKSGGNPRILEAMLQALVTDGALAWTHAGWAPRPGAEIRLTPGLKAIVRRRLARLGPASVDVLRQAAVLGPIFSFEALARMTGTPADELLGRVEEGIGAGILEEREAPSGGPRLAFADRPVRELLYEELSLVRRARYHASAARVLESVAAEGTSVSEAELAHHYLMAHDFDHALEHTVRAAEEAERLYAREEALRHYALAQELLDSRPDPPRRAELLFRAGVQSDLLGRHTEAYRAMREAAEEFEHCGLPVRAGEAHRSIARRITAHNEPVRAMEHLEQARKLLADGPPTVERARLYDTTGMIMFQEVRIAEARENWRRAIEAAREVGDKKIEASARMLLASVALPAEKATLWEELDAALALAREAAARTVVPNVMFLRAIALLHIRGDGRGALRAAEDALEYARRGRDVLHEAVIQGGVISYIDWRLGDLRRAEAVAQEHRAFAGGDPRRERPTAIAVLAEVALARGELARAEQLLWEAERLLAEGGDWEESAQTQIVLGKCALRRGRFRAAIDRLRTARELARKAGPPAMDALLLLETLELLARAELEGGAPDAAAGHLEELRVLAGELGEDLATAFVARAEGRALRARGEPAPAAARFAEATDLWKRLGWQLERARTLEELAGALRDAGDRAAAKEREEEAIELLGQLGATPERPRSGPDAP